MLQRVNFTTKTLLFLGVGSLALSACGGGQDLADFPVREVDWQFCGEDQNGNPECYEGTEAVWVAPDIDASQDDFIEPVAWLIPNITGHTPAIEAYGCFPRSDEPQELNRYYVGKYIPRQHDPDDDSIFQRLDETEIDVLEVRPLSEEQVEEWDGQAQVPVIALPSRECRAED